MLFEQILTKNLKNKFKELFEEGLEPRSLTDSELLYEVVKHYNEVSTKSAMLKLLRSLNFKVSQKRCYNFYLEVDQIYKESLREVNQNDNDKQEEYTDTEILSSIYLKSF